MIPLLYRAELHRRELAGAAGFEPAMYAGVKVPCLEPLGDAPDERWSHVRDSNPRPRIESPGILGR